MSIDVIIGVAGFVLGMSAYYGIRWIGHARGVSRNRGSRWLGIRMD